MELEEIERMIEKILQGTDSMTDYNAKITAGAIVLVLKESGVLLEPVPLQNPSKVKAKN